MRITHANAGKFRDLDNNTVKKAKSQNLDAV